MTNRVDGLEASAVPWKPFLNPLQQGLFDGSAEVDWLYGEYVRSLSKDYKRLAAREQWIVWDRRRAQLMVAAQRDAAVGVVGALLSWRSACVSQLQAGLCSVPVPSFDRSRETLWGALLRLGVIDVGFSKTERWGGLEVPETWIALSHREENLKRLLRLLDLPQWYAAVLSSGKLHGQRVYAFHNMMCDHVGLAAIHDPRFSFSAGDGWCNLRSLDEKALRQSGSVTSIAGGDVLMMTRGGVAVAVEGQGTLQSVEEKMRRWMRFLASSPMEYRGIVCVWLRMPNPHYGGEPDLAHVLERLRDDPLMLAGRSVPVSMRLGVASWGDWFDPMGRPAEGFGVFSDSFGIPRSVFDGEYSDNAPAAADASSLTGWGRGVLAETFRRVWGLDTSGWAVPDSYLGGFPGAAVMKADTDGGGSDAGD